jgi:hypothetical protein
VRYRRFAELSEPGPGGAHYAARAFPFFRGQPFFNLREEVSDINTVAEVLTGQPVTFTEPGFSPAMR